MTRDQSNLMAVAGDRGKVVIFNMANRSVLRTMFHPTSLTIHRVLICLHPVACIVMLSRENQTIYVYSINGQLLTELALTRDCHLMELGTDGCFADFVVRSTHQVAVDEDNSLTIANLPFLENKKVYSISRDIGNARITSCLVVDRGVACILGDSAGFISIFINEDNINEELKRLAKPELIPGLVHEVDPDGVSGPEYMPD